MTYKNKELSKARKSVSSGQNIDSAVLVMRKLADAGDGGAAASLAQVLAYQGKWDECIDYCITTQNTHDNKQIVVFTVKLESIDIMARAGAETKNWDKIVQFSRKRLDELSERCSPPWSEGYYKAVLEYADRNGAEPHIRNTCTAPLRKYGGDINEQNHLKDWSRHLEKNPTAKSNPDEATFWKFHSALTNAYSEGAIEMWERNRELIEREGSNTLSFHSILTLAKMYLDCAREESAWQVIEECLHYWLPQDKCQVLPVSLLADTEIRPIMNQERCLRVLAADKAGTSRKVR